MEDRRKIGGDKSEERGYINRRKSEGPLQEVNTKGVQKKLNRSSTRDSGEWEEGGMNPFTLDLSAKNSINTQHM